MKNKGFTLIELLAVIVVLAIIALIATPMVLRTIDESKEGSVKESANSYMSSLETNVAAKLIDGTSTVATGQYTVSEDKVTLVGGTDTIDVKVKGSKPAKGVLCINEKGIVTKYSIEVSDYTVDYNGFTKTVTKGENSKTSLTCDIAEKYKGDYTTGQEYYSEDVVLYNGEYYMYKTDIEAGETKSPSDLARGKGSAVYLPNYNTSYTEIDPKFKGVSNSYYGMQCANIPTAEKKNYIFIMEDGTYKTCEKAGSGIFAGSPVLENYNPYDSTTWY